MNILNKVMRYCIIIFNVNGKIILIKVVNNLGVIATKLFKRTEDKIIIFSFCYHFTRRGKHHVIRQ